MQVKLGYEISKLIQMLQIYGGVLKNCIPKQRAKRNFVQKIRFQKLKCLKIILNQIFETTQQSPRYSSKNNVVIRMIATFMPKY